MMQNMCEIIDHIFQYRLRISHFDLNVFNYFNVELMRVCFLKKATVAVIFK